MREPVMTVGEMTAFLRREFPQMYRDGETFTVVSIDAERTCVRLDPTEHHLRPGGTVSGPTLFTLADVTAYIATLAHIGPVALAVTTNLNINFLHRPKPGPLVCEARTLKLGRRLVVMDTTTTDADGAIVAQATATYSIPPR